MAEVRILYKIILFLSSYSPLFGILLVKNICQSWGTAFIPVNGPLITYGRFSLQLPSFNSIVSILLITVILLSVIGLWLIIYLCKDIKRDDNAPKPSTIKDYHKNNKIFIEYLIIYVVPFVAFDYSNIPNIIALIVLLIIVGFVYVRSDLLYANFLLLVAGYNLYEVEDMDGNDYMLISKRQVSIGQTIKYNTIDGDFKVEV